MIAGADAVPEVSRRRLTVTPAIELLVLALAIAVAIGSYFIVTGEQSPQRLLTPPVVALLLVANLLPGVALLVLIGRRIARQRAARSAVGGEGRLHVRLVALFSATASVPTLLVAIFASLLFQYGVEFWFSDRARGMLENASAIARDSYAQMRGKVDAETQTMAGDLRDYLNQAPIDSPQFAEGFGSQVYYRGLSEAAIVSVTRQNGVQTLALVNPYDRNLEEQVDPKAVNAIAQGKRSVVTDTGDRVQALTPIPGNRDLYLYAARVTDPQMKAQSGRAEAVLGDYRALLARSRTLQLKFHAVLLGISLLIVGFAVWIALALADRLVRPVGELVDAARRVESGDLTARVARPRSRDEIGTLTTAFNQMTGRLQEQTDELVSANSQLERRRALIEAVMSGVSAGVLSIAQDHSVRLANSSAVRLLGMGSDSPVGRQLAEFAPELDDLLANNRHEEIVQVSPGGEPLTLAVKAARDGGGWVLTFDDITQQQLDQRRAAWSDVARRIAHEIKNPLTPIQLAAERLQRRYGSRIGTDDGTFTRLTETIVRQVGDLRRMVDEFSRFARMPKPVFRAESLVDMGRQALFLHEVAHPQLRFRLDHDDPGPQLVCDRRQIGQALTNILKNAVEAVEAKGEEGGEIVMAIRGDDREVSVSIADSGVGLPPERDRIVEPYMTTRARGTGLGLAIVKKIAEEHHGTISFADRPGGGTVVTMTFDAAVLAELDGSSEVEETRRYDRPTILTLNRNG